MEPGQIKPEDTKTGGYYRLQFKYNGKNEEYVWIYKQSTTIKKGDSIYIPADATRGYNNENVTFADHISDLERCVISVLEPEYIRYFEHCMGNTYITFENFQKLKPKELPIFN